MVKGLKPQVIFLAGALGSADYCEAHPREAQRINADGTANVAQAAREVGARLVFYSSDYVFDGSAGPYTEDDPPAPLNVYGRTKVAAEAAIRGLLEDYLIIRTTVVFGWNRTSPNFAMQVWEHLQAGKELRVASDQWGTPTLADYLAEVSIRLVHMGVTGTINVVGKDRLPRAAFGQALARVMALDPAKIIPVPTAQLGQRAPRPLHAGLRTEKLQQLLGTETLDLGEALKRFRRQWRADMHVVPSIVAPSDDVLRLKQEILAKVEQYQRLAHQPKEFVPFQTRIQYAGRVYGAEELVRLVDSALDFWLTLGPYGDLFERRMRQFLGCRDFVLVNSGSVANLAAIMALMSPLLEEPLHPGDEVITPALTFPTTLVPIVHSGLVPVFVDCEIGTYNINPHVVEEAVSPRTRALMIPHTLGNPFALDALVDVARRHNLYLVEDSCDALGATYRGQMVGTFGDLGTLSFYPAHQMTMGEGGGVIVNRARLARVVRAVRDWGRDCWCAPGESNTCGRRFGWQLGELPPGYDHKYIYSTLGYNFKPTDMQAAIGVAQLDRVPWFVERRRYNFRRLYEGLAPFQDRLILPRTEPHAEPSWFGFPITVQNGLSRRELVQWLEAANIETRLVFAGNILRQPGFHHIPCRVHGELAASDRVMRDTFFIGVYPGITDEMLDFVIARFQAFFARPPSGS
jgi:CDP-6-deoxy-D-xylo-4-hexulose-3-dehydrase